MTTSDIIRQLCTRKNIILVEFCRRIGQTPQNFNKKLKRGTASSEEMIMISKVVNVEYEHAFIMQDREKVGINNIL